MGDSASPSIEGVVFITHSDDNTLTSIDLATGSKKTLKLMDISFDPLALNPSGNIISIAEGSDGISFNDTTAMTTIYRMDCSGWVLCVAWSLDGQYIAAGMRSGEVIIIDSLTRSIISEVKSHGRGVNTVSFNRTSDKLSSGSDDGTAIIYTVPDLTVLTTLEGHTNAIYCSLFLHDDRVVTGSKDETIRVWDADGNAIHIIKEHSSAVYSLAVSPDGKVLVSGGADNKLCIYDSDTYEMMASISCEKAVISLCFINNSIVLAGVHKSGMIAVDVQTGKVIKKYDGEYIWPSIAIRAQPERPIVVSLSDVSTYMTSHLHTSAFSAAHHHMISIACC